MAAPVYVPCTLADIPAEVRFDVPGHNQGQIVEVAYGTFSVGEAGVGDPYQRVIDRSLGQDDPTRVSYYRRVVYTQRPIVIAYGAAFAGSDWRDGYRARVEPDGTVMVYDPIARHYTTCHRLAPVTIEWIRSQAEQRDS